MTMGLKQLESPALRFENRQSRAQITRLAVKKFTDRGNLGNCRNVRGVEG